MSKQAHDILEECIKMLEAGATVEECLEQFPVQAAEIGPVLEAAKEAIQLGNAPITTEQVLISRNNLLARAKLLAMSNNMVSNQPASPLIAPIRRVFQGLRALNPAMIKMAWALGIAMLLIIFSGELIHTSAKSLPGDSLYPVKRAVEGIRVYLAASAEEHEYESSYSQLRVTEVKKLIELGRVERVSFEGILESMNGDEWVVSGISIQLQTSTSMLGINQNERSFEVGSLVEVEGSTTSEGQVIATEIHLRQYQMTGYVDEIGTNFWIISGTRYLTTPDTQIDPGIRKGDVVIVLVNSTDHGSYLLAILRQTHATAVPDIQRTSSAELDAADNADRAYEDDRKIYGRLDEIKSGYWVVEGSIVYIVESTQISGEVKQGDYISVEYRTEVNGSYTAISIEKTDQPNEPEKLDTQEPPETEGAREATETPEIAITPEDVHEITETPEVTETQEAHETPEPTEDGLHNP